MCIKWDNFRVFILDPLLIFPLIVLTWPFFAIYHFFVRLVVKLFKPNFGRVLLHPTTYVDEDFSKLNLPKFGFSFMITLDGDMSLEKVRQLFQENVLETKLEGKDVPRFPELRQILTSFMGFRFWKNQEDFDLTQHIFEGPSEWLNLPRELIYEETLKRKFYSERSPWEFILLRNYNLEGSSTPKTLLVLYIHHTIADARATVKLLVEHLGQTPLTSSQSSWNPKKGLSYYLKFPLKITFEFGAMYFKMWKCLNHPWRHQVPKSEGEQVGQYVRMTERIPKNDLKAIGKKFGVSPSAVILGLITGGMKRTQPYMRRFLCIVSLSKPDHPSRLTNHFWTSGVTLPCDTDTIPKRLQKCNKELNKVKDSQLGMYIEGLMSFTTDYLIHPLRKGFLWDVFYPIVGVITNVAGEERGFNVGGVECIDMNACAAVGSCPAGLDVAAVSFKGAIRFLITGEHELFTEESVQLLTSNIQEEYKSAMRLINENDSVFNDQFNIDMK